MNVSLQLALGCLNQYYFFTQLLLKPYVRTFHKSHTPRSKYQHSHIMYMVHQSIKCERGWPVIQLWSYNTFTIYICICSHGNSCKQLSIRLFTLIFPQQSSHYSKLVLVATVSLRRSLEQMANLSELNL